ncbi:MAG: regulatory protein RecX [Xanthomonadales bacterium]|nr:regulatory protein RecX [Xanthomonadales bacterium]
MPEQQIEQQKYSPEARARASALGSLAMREHSALELRQKLLRKNHPSDLVDDLIICLQQENLLSDRRFAESYWRLRADKGYGPMRIGKELQIKGVPSRIIDLARLETEIDFFAVVYAVYQKKYKAAPWSDYKEKAKRQAFLYRRGFDHEYINAVIET